MEPLNISRSPFSMDSYHSSSLPLSIQLRERHLAMAVASRIFFCANAISRWLLLREFSFVRTPSHDGCCFANFLLCERHLAMAVASRIFFCANAISNPSDSRCSLHSHNFQRIHQPASSLCLLSKIAFALMRSLYHLSSFRTTRHVVFLFCIILNI